MSQSFFNTFGVTPLAVLAYLGLHVHLFLLGLRLRRVESTPTVARELRAAHPTK